MMGDSATRLAPPRERLEMVDALRGFALMGLFIIHMSELYELYWAHPEPSIVHDAIFALFAGKAYALFALCFGFSFYIIMARAAERGEDFSLRFGWRLLLLFLIGWLHGIVYRGDIIVVLAALGLLLVPLNKIGSNRVLAALAALCFLLPFPLFRLIAGLAGADWANQAPNFATDDGSMAVYVGGSLGEFLHWNLWQGQMGKWWYYIESGRIMHIMGLFITGLILGRIGFFADPARFARARASGLAIALAVALPLSIWSGAIIDASGFAPDQAQPRGSLDLLLDAWRDLAWTAICLLLVVALWQGAGRILLAWLVPAGRMTLTLYVGQSLVFVPLFYGFGLGLHDDLTQAQLLALAIPAFAVQPLLAAWWFRRFRYGPLEWLWRAGTYARTDIPFRRPPPSP